MLMNKPTFVLAVNQDLIRLGFEYLIQAEIRNHPIEIVTTKSELRRALAMNDVPVVIIDFDTFDFSGIEEVATLAQAFPESKWLFVTNKISETFVLPLTSAMQGANLILKTNTHEIVVAALHATMAGKKYFCSEALDVILEGRSRKQIDHKSILTATENELVQLLAQGKTTKEIAEERCLSHHTVNTHRKNIFRKLEVNSVQELIKYALKHGLVDLTEYYI